MAKIFLLRQAYLPHTSQHVWFLHIPTLSFRHKSSLEGLPIPGNTQLFSLSFQTTKMWRGGSLWREECCLLELIAVTDILIFFNVTTEKWGRSSCVSKQYVEVISELFWLLSASVRWKHSLLGLSLWRTVVLACFLMTPFDGLRSVVIPLKGFLWSILSKPIVLTSPFP